jgi:hypothetical protein
LTRLGCKLGRMVDQCYRGAEVPALASSRGRDILIALCSELTCAANLVASIPSRRRRLGMEIDPGDDFWPDLGPCLAPEEEREMLQAGADFAFGRVGYDGND